MTHKKGQRKVSKKSIFFHGKDNRFSPRTIRKKAFSLDKYRFRNMGRKLNFAIQHIFAIQQIQNVFEVASNFSVLFTNVKVYLYYYSKRDGA